MSGADGLTDGLRAKYYYFLVRAKGKRNGSSHGRKNNA